jgi:hypothetical protein
LDNTGDLCLSNHYARPDRLKGDKIIGAVDPANSAPDVEVGPSREVIHRKMDYVIKNEFLVLVIEVGWQMEFSLH